MEQCLEVSHISAGFCNSLISFHFHCLLRRSQAELRSAIGVVNCGQTGEINGVTGDVWSGRRGRTQGALATSDSLTYGGSNGQSWLHNSACYKSRIRMKDCHKRDYCPFALMSQYISTWRRSPPDCLHKHSLTHSSYTEYFNC